MDAFNGVITTAKFAMLTQHDKHGNAKNIRRHVLCPRTDCFTRATFGVLDVWSLLYNISLLRMFTLLQHTMKEDHVRPWHTTP